MDKIGDQQTFKDGTTKTYVGPKYGYVTSEKFKLNGKEKEENEEYI